MPFPLLELVSIDAAFRHRGKSIPALRNISLSVPKGALFGIMGPSGAGKSTLLKLIAGLETATSGSILWEGVPLEQLSPAALRQWRRQIGIVFQQFHLLESRTALDNVALPLELARVPKPEREVRARELLELVELSHRASSYPAHLSGGEKQRVGIARAVAGKPQLLLCDEATSALDPKSTQAILQLLQRLQRELSLTIVLITHEMEVIKQICHQVAVLHQGEIVEQGSVSDLFTHPRHPMTQQLLETAHHTLPESLLKTASSDKPILRLRFRGASAREPVITEVIRRSGVEVNILSGWMDALDSLTIGSLVVQLQGSSPSLAQALAYLEERGVVCERIQS